MEPLHNIYVLRVLEEETNDQRFELFCCSFLNEFYGLSFVPTSRNYDQGRDGRGPADAAGTDFYTSTLMRSEKKPADDLKKIISKGAKVRHLYLCFSKSMTDAHLDKITRATLAEAKHNGPVTPNSAFQMAKVISEGRGAKAFREHYAAEYEKIIASLSSHIESVPSGFHLALGTIVHEDAGQLRKNLGFKIITSVLANGPLRPAAIQAAVAKEFGFSHFTVGAVEHYCREAEIQKLVNKTGQEWNLTPEGVQFVSDNSQLKIDDYVRGQLLVRQELEKITGANLSDLQWNAIWAILEKGIVELFHNRGLELTATIKAFVENKRIDTGPETTWERLKAIFQRAADTQSAALKDVIQNGLILVFSPANVAISKWLNQLAATYVVLCTLGFEQSVGAAVREALSGVAIYFDTDILLSYLCAHETMHTAAGSVKQFIESTGKKVTVGMPVVEECALHAARAIRERETLGAKDEKPLGIAEIELMFGTVFGREYEFLRAEGHSLRWDDFISTYSGRTTWAGGRPNVDAANLKTLLLQDKFEVLSPRSEDQKRAAERLQAKIIRARPDAYSDFEKRDKLRIDLELLLSIQGSIQVNQLKGVVSSILITSSGKFRPLKSFLDAEKLELPELMRLEEVMWMISLLPHSPISLQDLGAFLFEGRTGVAFAGIEEKLIMRILQYAHTVSLLPAQKSVAVHRLRAGMYREAKKMGNPNKIIKDSVHGNDPMLFGKLATAAFDADAETTRTPEEKQKVRESLDQLTLELKSSIRPAE